ncbi:MAG: glycosyltransferase family 4 protein [Planctomycetota bacterium]
MRVTLIVAFTLAFVMSLALTWLMRRLSLYLGFVDEPGGRKKHEEATPQGGGVAILFSTSFLIVGAAAVAYFAHHYPDHVRLSAALARQSAGAAQTLPLLLHILGGGLAVAFFGFWDDIRPFPPIAKLTFQFVIISIIVLTSGIRISLFIQSDFAQAGITIVWIVLLTNSFNLLDNMDGLCSSVAVICGGTLLILALQTGQLFIAGFMLAIVGSVLGFLFFNFPPATIFMGDTGSMFLGYMLATATTLSTFMSAGQTNPLFPMLVPLIIFAVPLYDTLSVLLIRLYHRKHPLAGDRNHLSHRLYRLGLPRPQVLAIIVLMTLATSLGATIPYGGPVWMIMAPTIQTLAALCVLVQLELASAEVSW